MESVLYQTAIPEHGACFGVWLIYPVSCHWRKLVFLSQYALSAGFLLTEPSSPPLNIFVAIYFCYKSPQPFIKKKKIVPEKHQLVLQQWVFCNTCFAFSILYEIKALTVFLSAKLNNCLPVQMFLSGSNHFDVSLSIEKIVCPNYWTCPRVALSQTCPSI